jgi:hypothetical protein
MAARADRHGNFSRWIADSYNQPFKEWKVDAASPIDMKFLQRAMEDLKIQ